MKISKRVISDLQLCYCVAPVTYRGEEHFVVASEKEYPCLLFDRHGKFAEKIWDAPGGTMSIVQVPETDGAFLATHEFYSPNNSNSAKIVLCRPTSDGWKVTTLAQLPCVHRFDILQRGDTRYLLACTIKERHEYKEDWRFPGAVYACKLPDDLLEKDETYRLPLQMIKSGMNKNHGYSRSVYNSTMCGIVSSDEGVFRFIPPENDGGPWQIRQLLSEPASDALLIDFDGDGEDEIIVLSPFHGDTVSIYKRAGEKYGKIFEYENKLEFVHAVCAGRLNGRNIAFVGHRRGGRDLLAVSCVDGEYKVEPVDHDVGSANVLFSEVDGSAVLLSANREINEVAYYTITAD